MTRMDCDAVRENIDAWAIGALYGDEARALEAHLAGCTDCSTLADDAVEVAAALSLLAPLTASPQALKSRIVASAAVLSDIGRPQAPPRTRMWPLAAAALFVAVVGAFGWGALMQARVDDLEGENATMQRDATVQSSELVALRTQVASEEVSSDSLRETLDQQRAVIDVVLEPDVQRTMLTGTEVAPAASARCLWSRASSVGALIASDLPPPPEGKQYVMWIVYENEWVNAGSFSVDADGRGHLVMTKVWPQRADPGAFEGFAVTIESPGTLSGHSDQLVLRSAT